MRRAFDSGIFATRVDNLQFGFNGLCVRDQQVAQLFLLGKEYKFTRKIKEAILSIRIEQTFTKDRILELYLNEIYLGLGNYGVAAAALNLGC